MVADRSRRAYPARPASSTVYTGHAVDTGVCDTKVGYDDADETAGSVGPDQKVRPV